MGDGDTADAAAYDDDKLDFLPVAADFEYAADMEVEDEGSAPPPGGSPRSEPATASREQTKPKADRPTDPRKYRQQIEGFGLASRPTNDSDGDRHSSRRSSKNWSPDRHSEASHRRRSRSPGPHSKRNNSRSPRRHRSRSRSPRRRDPRGDPRKSRQESSKSRTSRHEESEPKRSRDDDRSYKRGSRAENGGQQQTKPEHAGGNLAQAWVAPVQMLPVQPVQESEEPFGDIYESSPTKVDAAVVSSSDYIVQNGTHDTQPQQDDETSILDTYVSERDPVPKASSPPLADNRSSPKHGSEDEAEAETTRLSTKDKKALMLLRVAVADHVKEVLKPTWKEGHMAKDVYKTIVKKAVDKVLSTLKSHQIPRSREKVDHFMTFSRHKISKLVQGYVEKYQKKSS